LSYGTGTAGADRDATLGTDRRGTPVPRNRKQAQGRILLRDLLSVAGFTVVFILTGLVAAQAGRALLVHQRVVEIVVGLLVIALGLAFAGLVPGLQRDLRI